MKIKRLLARAKLGFFDSVLDLAAWINRLGSEERRNPYRCPLCGSTDIHILAWIAPNRGGRYVEDRTDADYDQDWCQRCEKYIGARPTDELLNDAYEWWKGSEFIKMELITGYSQYDFDPEEGYQAFIDVCNEWWNDKTIEEKISIHLANS